MKNTAFIVAPSCGGIGGSIKLAFFRIGWNCIALTYDAVRLPRIGQKILYKCFLKYRDHLFYKGYNVAIRNIVIPQLRKSEFSLLLILKGHYLDYDNKESLSKLDVPIITWAYDSLDRCPEMIDSIKLSTHVFFTDGGDINCVNKSSTWLPLGYDDEIFFPKKKYENKIFDILMVGIIGKKYGERRKIFTTLSKSSIMKNYKIAFVGTTGRKYKDYMFGYNCHMKWLAKYLPLVDLADLISSSKVCINIHQDDGKMPINPWFFSIPGAKVCQVTDKRSYLSEWLTPGKDYVDFDVNELVPTLIETLNRNDFIMSISDSGYKHVLKTHTYKERVLSILKKI
jgi:hypothetical protein